MSTANRNSGGDYRPDEFNRIIAMQLLRRGRIGTLAEAHDGQDQPAFYKDKDDGSDDQDEPEESLFLRGNRAVRIQDRRGISTTCGKKNRG